MRLYGIAIVTLAVLLTGSLSAQAEDNAIATADTDDANQTAITPDENINVAVPTVTDSKVELAAAPVKAAAESFAPPETINIPETSRLQPSTSPPQAQVTTNNLVSVGSAATQQAFATKPENSQIKISDNNKKLPTPSEISSLSTPSSAQILRTDNPSSQQIAQAQPQAKTTCIAQATPGVVTTNRCPRPQAIPRIAAPKLPEESGASPALSIYIPVGYGADNNTIFLNGSYQPTVREDDGSVGTGGIGIGLGDADKAAGLELSYALATNENFGEGGFNAKLHKRFGTDLAGALGWNGFLNIGRNDFEHSKYGVVTKVIRTQESLNSPFSRVAVTVGVGDGQFRSNGAVDAGENNVNVFGNVAVRVIRPVSFIAEWTGQDLALGLSIAPFKNFPLVITPAFRDVAGAGDGARFVVGAGTALRF